MVPCFIPDRPLNGRIIFLSHPKTSQVQQYSGYSPCNVLLIPDVFSACLLENVLVFDVQVIWLYQLLLLLLPVYSWVNSHLLKTWLLVTDFHSFSILLFSLLTSGSKMDDSSNTLSTKFPDLHFCNKMLSLLHLKKPIPLSHIGISKSLRSLIQSFSSLNTVSSPSIFLFLLHLLGVYFNLFRMCSQFTPLLFPNEPVSYSSHFFLTFMAHYLINCQ